MKPTAKELSARYLKIVEWSEEDRCFVGRCPGLFFGGCHGEDEAEVYRELCGLVEEHVAALQAKKGKLPVATAGNRYSGKFLVRVDPQIHQKAALKASLRGESLNQFVATAIANA
ncbi:MAG: toxin-antitoxin system HicB family antitoxin [Opitutaceae bacterium]|nr:toxin-antitoxin system HicB family antitoxin [Opitutaceae bacterium]